ncbi:MAG: metallophosphoesterase [Phycisphaerales bacterium]|nr:MAG: metallophosphoesterase [Phycisphaerales bacterium]
MLTRRELLSVLVGGGLAAKISRRAAAQILSAKDAETDLKLALTGHKDAADCIDVPEMVGRVTDHSAVVNVVTAADFDGQVRARVAWASELEDLHAHPSLSAPVAANEPSARLELPLTGLQPNRRYYYQVQYETSDNPDVWTDGPRVAEFSTRRSAGQAFSFCTIADPHWGARLSILEGSPRHWTGRQCLRHIEDACDLDFCIDLGDSPYPTRMERPEDGLDYYASWRRLMGGVTGKMPVFLVLGNHDQEAGFYQRGTDKPPTSGPGNRLSADQYHQKWATEARLRYMPNPRGDTYPEGGEGAPEVDTAAEWGAGSDPWNDGTRSHLQNFYAWTWGDALFVVLDPFRYTLTEAVVRPTSPRQWTLGPTQMRWLEQVLAHSQARWKFVVAHHQVGGLVAPDGEAYGRGGASVAKQPGTEQATIHALMREHGAQFFVYGHDHAFAHTVMDDIHYLCCGRPTYLNGWWGQQALVDNYGSLLTQGREVATTRSLYNVLGYTRFEVTPDRVRVRWIRTGYSFRRKDVPLSQARRDWLESWVGRAYSVDSDSSVSVQMIPTDVDGVYVPEGARLPSLFAKPPGKNLYVQPDPVRPERFKSTRVPAPGLPERLAVVDTVPELVYEYTWEYPSGKPATGP